MPDKIFVNYRRDDARDAAARLRDRLAARDAFGYAAVFMDVDHLRPGQRFDTELEKALAECDVFLAVIGRHWLEILEARAKSGERDFVREEIAAALARKITVIPVLVDGAALPPVAALPEDIRDLVMHHAHKIAYESFGRDAKALIDAIREERVERRRRERATGGRPWRIAASFAGAVVIGGGLMYVYRDTQRDVPPRRPEPVVQEPAPPKKPPVITVEKPGANTDGPRLVSTPPAKPQPPLAYEDAAQRLVRTLSGHTVLVCSVAMSADGRLALSGSADATLKLWDVATGRELRTLSGHTSIVTSVAISPDGRLALSGSWDKTLKLWDVASGKELRTLSGHTDWVRSVALSADGRLALSGSDDKTSKLWDVASGKELRTLSGHKHSVWSVAISADGRLALSGSLDNTLKLWDVASAKELRTLSGHTGYVYSVAFSADGRYLVSGSGAFDSTTASYKNGQIKLWVASTGVAVKTWDFPDAGIWSVAFSADGRFVLSGSADKTAKLFDVSEWTQAK